LLILTIDEILRATGGRSLCTELPAGISGVSTDTRTIKPGDLFIPLSGEKYDGHDFIGEAFGKGAAVSLAEKKSRVSAGRGPLIEVEDSIAAYQALASCYLGKLNVRVVAVTGSAGKTTTKDLIGTILEKRFPVVKSRESFNNEIGVPATIFGLGPEDRVAVLEMAMRGREQIRPLARMSRPDVGVITNIGEAHFELLGSVGAIADAKGELLEEMGGKATAVLNADDGWLEYLRNKAGCRIITFGESKTADVRLEKAEALGLEGYRLDISLPSGKCLVKFPLLGKHNVINALAAMAVGVVFGLDTGEMTEALEGVAPASRRMEHRVLPGGIVLLLDCYNANPAAMRQALDTLKSLKAGGRKIALLGDMLELGEIALQAHRETGAYAASAGLDALYTVGALGEIMAGGARDAGLEAEKIKSFSSNEEAAGFLSENLRDGDLLLIKASRRMKMEEVADLLSVSV
jgi:UDP-N-acetylmuramoyl-tripeptide--D-alanyl-D-alanine ligase